MLLLPELKSRFRPALTALVDQPEEFLDQIRRSQDPKFGDYQANMAMSLAKRLGRKPREVAAEIVGRFDQVIGREHGHDGFGIALRQDGCA